MAKAKIWPVWPRRGWLSGKVTSARWSGTTSSRESITRLLWGLEGWTTASYDRIVEHRIRPGTTADVTAVLDLWLDAAAEPTHTDDVGSLTRLVAHDPAALLVAEERGRLVGSVIAGW